MAPVLRWIMRIWRDRIRTRSGCRGIRSRHCGVTCDGRCFPGSSRARCPLGDPQDRIFVTKLPIAAFENIANHHPGAVDDAGIFQPQAKSWAASIARTTSVFSVAKREGAERIDTSFRRLSRYPSSCGRISRIASLRSRPSLGFSRSSSNASRISSSRQCQTSLSNGYCRSRWSSQTSDSLSSPHA